MSQRKAGRIMPEAWGYFTSTLKFGFAALLVTGLVAGCTRGKDKPGEDSAITADASEDAAARRREERRVRNEAANPQDFSYFRYAINTEGNQPVACFVFSAALDPEKDYSPYVDFRPAFQPALTVNGRELCVGGLAYGTERVATLRSGLPAADGRALKRSEEVPISFQDRPAYVGFKGTGIILPRSDADGLPIETINVDSIEITVSRINDRALAFKRVGAGETISQGRYSYIWGEDNPQDVGEEIFKGTMKVKTRQNLPIITVFPMKRVVGALKPGAYFVSVKDAAKLTENEGPPASATRWIMMTDLALTAYEGEHGLDITLRSLQNGKPVSDATVQLIAANNALLGEAKSNGAGRVAFDKPLTAGQGTMAARLVLARNAAGELAMLDLQRAPVDLSAHETGGRTTPGLVDAYAYTERGIYRPGESVYLTAMLRDRAGRQIVGRKGHVVIYRPNGLVASKTRFDNPASGAVKEVFSLPKGASRGEWRAAIEIDGMTGEAGEVRFSVEDFVPQRLKAELKGDEKTPMAANGVRLFEVNSRFLYGAPGAGLTVQSEARVEVDPSPFTAFEGFTFGRHDQVFDERMIEFEDATTDGRGVTTLRLEPNGIGQGSGRPLRLNTVVHVLEPGGRAVSESARIPYRPDALYVGLKPRFDYSVDNGKDAAFDIAAISPAGKGVAHKLKWQMLAIDEHYDWYNDGGDWRWRTSRTVTKVNEGFVTTSAGGTAEVKVASLDWGLYQLVVESEKAGVGSSHEFYVGWGGQMTEDGVEAPDRVRVATAAKSIMLGKAFDVTIDAPYDGQAQLVVATDRVLSTINFAVKKGANRQRLTPTAEWGEGAYILANVYTARDPVLSAKPRRAVGVHYVPVNMDGRTFKLAITAEDVARPETEQTIEVNINNGPREPVYLTLAAVDEGILQLTKFKSPDPVAHYYGRKALGIALYDDYGRLLDPNMGFPGEVRSGGDQLGGEGLTVVPVKSVALYEGIVDTGRTGKATVKVKLPAFNGELRLMAVAWSKNGLGAASDKMIVRDAAPSELVLPRFLAPGDEAFLTASVDNVELGAGNFTGKLTGSGPVKVADANFSRSLAKGQRTDLPVRVRASSEGLSKVRLAVSGPSSFSASRAYDIQSRSPYLPETRVSRVLMKPGESYAVTADLLKGYVAGSSSVTVGFSRLPVDPASLYASLDRYPYGCTEQTTSRAMPLLYSEELVAMGATGARDNTRDKVQVAVNTLLNRQSADGAFGLWREGDGYATPWLGAYTTDFIWRAKEAGYSVPDEALSRAYASLRTVASGEAWRVYGYDTQVYNYWSGSNESEQQMMYRGGAYALYVLARAGETKVSRLRYLHDQEINQIDSPLARAHIAAGLAHLGDRSRATSAFKKAIEKIGYRNDADYYQTPLRDVAAILALAAETGMSDAVKQMASRVGRDTPEANLLTTQEKSFLLMAVHGLTKGEKAFDLKVAGLEGAAANQRNYAISEAQAKKGATFTLGGGAPLFRTVMVTGAPTAPPPATGDRLRADKAFYTLAGGQVDLSRVRQGDRIVVGLTVKPEEQRLVPMIIADLLPAGFEIETVLRPADGASNSDGSLAGAFSFLGDLTYTQTQQAQDDRFIAAVNTQGETVRVGYIVRAVTPGNFAIPGVVAEDMYRPDVFARSAPGRVTISTGVPQPTGGK